MSELTTELQNKNAYVDIEEDFNINILNLSPADSILANDLLNSF